MSDSAFSPSTLKLVEQLVRLGKGIIRAMEEWLREQRGVSSPTSKNPNAPPPGTA